ncbi:hypothetical protein BOTBODRAFT_297585 [Botryobasidium botryosum FD-172 SS1]|uniref:Nephrocystin 3-like N-terminal domain-containing protein n=1 Tax=Botryobasidium botryosum (strain FD-172 SS1) TaxID=930990 RepID=A0A067MID5_BOTB1|nr:hypothetical protein BOTBODRAFT_297585 [Botryobasidium botryosum FD-172 SS1]
MTPSDGDKATVAGAATSGKTTLSTTPSDGNKPTASDIVMTKTGKKTANTDKTAADLGKETTKQAQEMKTAPPVIDAFGKLSEGASAAQDMANEAKDVLKPLASVIKSLGFFVEAMDGITQVHPYAHAAWKILSAAYKVAKAQQDRDEAVLELLEAMNKAFELARQIDLIPKLKSQKEGVLLAHKAHECALFIAEYTRTTGFVRRLEKNLLRGSDVDGKVDGLKKDFSILYDNLQLATLLANAEMTWEGFSEVQTKLSYIKGLVDTVREEGALRELKVAGSWSLKDTCLENTRTTVHDDIVKWVHDVPKQGLNQPFFLAGIAGSGKTAVASTLASEFEELGYLGAAFFFKRLDADASTLRLLFSTLARGLAAHDEGVKSAVVAVLSGDSTLATADPSRQLQRLFLTPCQSAPDGGPLPIIIDAIDECTDQNQLSEFLKGFPSLPPRFRVILTGRRGLDISNNLEGLARIYELPYAGKEITRDISSYLTYRLRPIGLKEGLGDEWPSDDDLIQLEKLSSGLFVWARTVCDLLEESSVPQTRLEELLSDRTLTHSDINDLYSAILKGLLFKRKVKDEKGVWREGEVWKEDEIRDAYFAYMGIIVTARNPLSADAIDSILTPPKGEEKLKLRLNASKFLGKFGVLLDGVGSGRSETPVTTLHFSFPEFLVSKEASEIFYINKTRRNAKLAWACFRQLRKAFEDNTYDFGGAYTLNSEISEEEVNSHIGEDVRYAAVFVLDHLCDVARTENHEDLEYGVAQAEDEEDALKIFNGVEGAVQTFLELDLLHWLKVLSLLDRIDVAYKLDDVGTWLQKNKCSHKPIHDELIRDFSRFLRVFGEVISTAALQIYPGSLSFLPAKTTLRDQYTKRATPEWTVYNGDEVWSPSLAVLAGHTRSVEGCLFSSSPKDTPSRIASWSGSTARLWDGDTGALMGVIDRERRICCMAFSPDGDLLAIGFFDGVVQFWNGQTGAPVAGDLTYAAGANHYFVVLFSPSGDRLLTGTSLWNLPSRTLIASLPTGKLSFLPDGNCMVASYDGMSYEIFDTNGVFLDKKHLSSDFSLTRSPNGKRWVARPIKIGDIRPLSLWDLSTGRVKKCDLVLPPKVDSDMIISIKFFSTDQGKVNIGAYCKSDQNNNIIRLWDADTGNQLRDIRTVPSGISLFSPNGKLAAVLSGPSICVFDLETETISDPLVAHTNDITSIVFSPDATRLLSASDDHTLRLWDVTSMVRSSDNIIRHTTPIVAIDFSHQTNLLLSASEDCIRVWDVGSDCSQREIKTGLEGSDPVLSACFLPDGGSIATVQRNSFRLWSCETYSILKQVPGDHPSCRYLAASPQRDYFVAQLPHCNAICLWDGRTYQAKRNLPHDWSGLPESDVPFVLSPSGNLLASLGNATDRSGRLYVWDPRTLKEVAQMKMSGSSIANNVHMSFSPDETRVIVGTDYGSVDIWDARTGAQIQSFRTGLKSNRISRMDFSADQQIVTVLYPFGDVEIDAWSVLSEARCELPQVVSDDFMAKVNKMALEKLGWLGSWSEVHLLYVPHEYRRDLRCFGPDIFVINMLDGRIVIIKHSPTASNSSEVNDIFHNTQTYLTCIGYDRIPPIPKFFSFDYACLL